MSKKRNFGYRLFLALTRIGLGTPSILFVTEKNGKDFTENGELESGNIFICNHVGSSGPLMLEKYFPFPLNFWRTFEMCGTLRERYDYLKEIYFLNKKHRGKFLSKILALFGAPITGIFYNGASMIPTYHDLRMGKNIQSSCNKLTEGENILIFPENSDDGYFDVLTEYFGGFYILAKRYYEKTGKNVKIYNMYYKKKTNELIIDKPCEISELLKLNKSHNEIAEIMKNRANELSSITNKHNK